MLWRGGEVMNYPHFVLIEQESTDGPTQHYVVHTQDPKLAVKFSAEVVNGRLKPGSILRIAVPNCWAGHYSQYSQWVAKAEAFFRASLSPEADSGGGRGRGI